MASSNKFQGVSAPSSPKNTPTVPMSVYRELAAELQETKEQLDHLKQENQQLHHDNKNLRLEMSKLVHSVQNLENSFPVSQASPEIDYWQENPSPTEEEIINPLPQESREKRFTHQPPQAQGRERQNRQSSPEIKGWLVAAAMLTIILTFSGIGFMIARPLINQSAE